MRVHSHSTRKRLLSAITAGCAILLAAGCADTPTVPYDEPGPGAQPGIQPLGVVEITISGLADGAQPTASALSAASVAELQALREGGPLIAHALTGPDNAAGGGDGTIQLEPHSTGSFTDGERGDGGVRYVYATFRVRNAQSDGTAYDTHRQNLTFLAVATDGTIGETTVSHLGRFDGSAAADAIAEDLLPTGAAHRDPDGTVVSSGADVLQVLTEAEVAALTPPSGVTTVFPYGFVVRNPNDASSRTLPDLPTADQFDGVVTFAFKLPLQATSAEDPFTISIMVMGQDDSETRLTHSIEESGAAGSAQADARASALGASTVRVLPGASYTADGTLLEPICAVRVAGTAASPTGYLVNETVGSVAIMDPGVFLLQGKERSLGLEIQGSGGQLLTLPARWTVAGEGIESVDGMGTVVGVRRLGPYPVLSTLSASACGQTSGDVVLWTTGYVSIAGGWDHSLAIRADGTVVGWGRDDDGQATPPGGLADVVQVAAGLFFSLALRADGTVVGWGRDGSGQATPPGGLTDVVQIVTGAAHSIALKADGTIVGWGDDADGQVTPPGGLTDVVQIAAGNFHSLTLKADGTVVGWGDDANGQATPPAGLTDVMQIAAGGDHSLALRADGTVAGWGLDGNGQATPPTGLTDVVQIAAGDAHSLALRADGTVVGWGEDPGSGVLLPPANPPGDLRDVVQIASGNVHSLALRADGTVVGWGDDALGQATPPSALVALVP